MTVASFNRWLVIKHFEGEFATLFYATHDTIIEINLTQCTTLRPVLGIMTGGRHEGAKKPRLSLKLSVWKVMA